MVKFTDSCFLLPGIDFIYQAAQFRLLCFSILKFLLDLRCTVAPCGAQTRVEFTRSPSLALKLCCPNFSLQVTGFWVCSVPVKANFVVCFYILGINPRDLCIQGKCPTTFPGPHPLAFLYIYYFFFNWAFLFGLFKVYLLSLVKFLCKGQVFNTSGFRSNR